MERLAGKVILLWGWRRALAALLAGALAAFGQPPYDFFAVCFISFPVLVWLLDGAAAGPGAGLLRRAAGAFAIGWWFGFGYFLAGLWWTGNALLVQADLFAWALPFALFGLPALLAVFHGLATVIARLLWSDDLGRIAGIAFGFGIAEWLRGFVLTGFPWNPIGGAAMPIPLLMQSVGVVGVIGMNALAVFVFAMPALIASGKPRAIGFVLAAALVAAHLGYGQVRLAGSDRDTETLLRVRIVQPSILQTDKWDRAEQDRIFSTYVELSRQPPAEGASEPELILWPETAVPFLFSERPDTLVALAEMIDDDQVLLAGAVRAEAAGPANAGRYYNSVVAINSAGVTYDAVDKIHLVPFGEYLPFADMLEEIGVGRLVRSVAPFSAGAGRHAIDTVEGVGVLPFICYEIIFPGLVGSADGDVDMLLNVTNDAWFGDTPGPYQHFRQAQFRAVETGLPLARAANNGISGVIDAYGRVVDALAVNAVGALDVAVPRQRLERPSPVAPATVGALVVAAFGLAALMAAIYSSTRKY